MKAHMRTDRLGRPYRTYVCDVGHWHRSHRQAVTCNQKNRKDPT